MIGDSENLTFSAEVGVTDRVGVAALVLLRIAVRLEVTPAFATVLA